jgi:hypothetical protein
MNPPPKERRAVASAPIKTANDAASLTAYSREVNGRLPLPSPVRKTPTSEVCGRGKRHSRKRLGEARDIRRCVVCEARVTNANLGGYDGRSALNAGLYCLSCADGRDLGQ